MDMTSRDAVPLFTSLEQGSRLLFGQLGESKFPLKRRPQGLGTLKGEVSSV